MNKKNQKKKPEETKPNFYIKNYKKLIIIPIILLLISVFFIYVAISKDSSPIYRDISLKGGLSAIISIESDKNADDVSSHFNNKYNDYSFSVSTISEDGINSGFLIDTTMDEESFIKAAEEYFNIKLEFSENYSSNFISPTLSAAFFKQAVMILIISFILMSIVIFWYFREIIPSGAVVISAIFDVIVTIGFLNAIEFEISIAGIGALLMLIGYSIDTDVLLTNRLIKESGDNYFEKTFEAFKTGTLMTGTTMAAGLIAMLVTNSNVIFEIAFILFIGLIVDFISTWIQNTGILLWWLEKKNSK